MKINCKNWMICNLAKFNKKITICSIAPRLTTRCTSVRGWTPTTAWTCGWTTLARCRTPRATSARSWTCRSRRRWRRRPPRAVGHSGGAAATGRRRRRRTRRPTRAASVALWSPCRCCPSGWRRFCNRPSSTRAPPWAASPPPWSGARRVAANRCSAPTAPCGAAPSTSRPSCPACSATRPRMAAPGRWRWWPLSVQCRSSRTLSGASAGTSPWGGLAARPGGRTGWKSSAPPRRPSLERRSTSQRPMPVWPTESNLSSRAPGEAWAETCWVVLSYLCKVCVYLLYASCMSQPFFHFVMIIF